MSNNSKKKIDYINSFIAEPEPNTNPYEVFIPQDPPKDVWDEQPKTNTPNINPFLELLGVHLDLPKNDGGVVMSAVQQRQTKKEYPALTSLFGTKLQSSNLDMSDSEGDGGSNGNPGDEGPIQGGVETTVYPDGYPSDYPVDYPNDPNGGGNEPSGGNEPQQQNPSNSFGAVVKNVLAQTLGVTFDSAQQAAVYRNNEETSSPIYKASVSQMNTSIDALKETHQIQQKNLSSLLSKVTAADNQEEYSKLLQQYAQEKERAQEIKDLTTRIEYSAENKDYGNVANEIQNYTVPDQADSHTPTNPNWQYSSNNNELQAGLDKSFNNSDYNDYGHPATENYPNYPAQNPMPNYDNSTKFPVFKVGISNDVPVNTVQPEKGSQYFGTITETGEAMSAGATITDFMERLNTIPEIDSNLIKQAFATYQGPTGQKIQAELQAKLQVEIEKIAQECIDGAKAFKLATEISKKVAPILTFAYIAQQFVQGFQNKGVWDGILRGVVAIAESFIATAVFSILIATELTVLPAATLTLLASLVIEYLLEQVLNHFKL